MNDNNDYITMEMDIEPELYDKLQLICKYYGHPLDIQLPSIIDRYVMDFERVHGPVESIVRY